MKTKTVMKILLMIIVTCVTYVSYAENIELILTPPAKYSNGVDVEPGAITKHTVYCNNGVQVDIMTPEVSVVIDFPASDDDYGCHYTTTAHALESDPSNTVSFSVGWVKTNPPVGLPIAGNSTRSINLSWSTPTQNTDDTDLTDLTGFKVYYGLDENDLNNVVDVNNPLATNTDIANLATPNTHYFSITAVSSLLIESDRSAIASKFLN